MKQFKTIFLFELLTIIKKKSFIFTTIFLVIISAIVFTFPRVFEMFGEGNNSQKKADIVAIVDKTNTDEKTLKNIFDIYFDNEIVFLDADINELKKDVSDLKYKRAIYIETDKEYTYISNKVSQYDKMQYKLNDFMETKYQTEKMTELGLDENTANNIINANIIQNNIVIDDEKNVNFSSTYILIFLLYFVVIFYGNTIASNVAREKESKVVEILITKAKPFNLILSKILSAMTGSLIQIGIVFASFFVFYKLNAKYWSIVSSTISSVDALSFVYLILFFIVGFYIYAILYGLVASFASKIEDINTLSMPIIIIFIVIFSLVITNLYNVSSLTMKILSYFPLSSPMAMFARINLGDAGALEGIISLIILIVTSLAMTIFSSKIYILGINTYNSNKPKNNK